MAAVYSQITSYSHPLGMDIRSGAEVLPEKLWKSSPPNDTLKIDIHLTRRRGHGFERSQTFCDTLPCCVLIKKRMYGGHPLTSLLERRGMSHLKLKYKSNNFSGGEVTIPHHT